MSKEPYSPEFQKFFDSCHPKFQAHLKDWCKAFSNTQEFEEWWTRGRNKGRKIPNSTVDIFAKAISAPEKKPIVPAESS